MLSLICKTTGVRARSRLSSFKYSPMNPFQNPSFKMKCTLAGIVLVALVHCVFCQFENTIFIDSNSGTDTSNCTNGKEIPCKTLEYALEKGNQSSTEFVLSSNLRLSRQVNVSDLHLIKIRGNNCSTQYVLDCNYPVIGESAGLVFKRVTNLSFSCFSIQQCGSILSSTSYSHKSNSMLRFRSALYILNSTDVSIDSVNFTNNPGIGLVLFDTNGSVAISNSTFNNNKVPKPESERHQFAGGGGLYIEHTYCTPGNLRCVHPEENHYSSDSVYLVSHCHFADNTASILPEPGNTWVQFFEKNKSTRLGRGGGIAITLKGASKNNVFEIVDCTFERNTAQFGGGLNIQFQDTSTNNTLRVSDTNFNENKGSKLSGSGGGAFFLGIFFYGDDDSVFENNVTFTDVNFSGNQAVYGGGIMLTSSRMKHQSRTNDVTFFRNTWSNNSAYLGAAVLVSPDAWNSHALSDGYSPTPVFDNCTFMDNNIDKTGKLPDPNVSPIQTMEGVFYSSSYSLNFSTSVTFQDNSGTALSITAGIINILENTTATFIGNRGNRGGALALLEFATLRTFPGSVLNFTNNSATSAGGAIYASSSDDTDFYYSRSCFIVYSDDTKPDPKDWNTGFIFEHNHAGPNRHLTSDLYGESIYATSLQACDGAIADKYCQFFNRSIFSFSSNTSISTDPYNITILQSSQKIKMSPGESTVISLQVIDECNNKIQPVFTASISSSSADSVALVPSPRYISDNSVKVLADSEEQLEFNLTLYTLSRRIISVSFNNCQLCPCPPGYYYDNTSKKCVCSATKQNGGYNGISKCDERSFSGILDTGHWAGYYHNESDPQNQTFATANCPIGFCKSQSSSFFTLNNTLRQDDSLICSENRNGILCGNCTESVFYHSRRFNCDKCNQTRSGIPLYLVSEILPVTILFIIIVGFNIHLTSGLWCSVILFGQVIDFFEVDSFDSTMATSNSSSFEDHYFLYSSFNLDFFKCGDYLSFCLWEGAQVMEVLLFKYLTTMYTILLLVALVIAFRFAPCQKLWDKCTSSYIRGARRQTGVIHGIAAFLVLSYAQCAKVSFQILSGTELLGEGGKPLKRVALLNGEDYFRFWGHAEYAIPALLVILVMAFLPFILLVYPMQYKVFHCCLGEECYEKFTSSRCCTIFSLTKFKPLFDAFQFCYKDNYRFFAGLLFLYRFLVAACYAFSTNVTTLYISLEVIIVFMLGLHTLFQPYTHRFYNVLDSLVLTNLAVVNALNLFILKKNSAAYVFQLILSYLPLVYIVVMAIAVLATRYSEKVRNYLSSVNTFVPLFEVRATSNSYESLEQSRSRQPSINEPDNNLPYRIYEEDQRRDMERSGISHAVVEERVRRMYQSTD